MKVNEINSLVSTLFSFLIACYNNVLFMRQSNGIMSCHLRNLTLRKDKFNAKVHEYFNVLIYASLPNVNGHLRVYIHQ